MMKQFVTVLSVFLMGSFTLFSQVIPAENDQSEQGNLKDSVIMIKVNSKEYALKDYQSAYKYDSIWQAELTSSDLYPKMQESIVDMPYDDAKELSPMDYKDLPTDLLKKRLADLDAKTPFGISYDPAIERMIHFYLKRDKKTMERLMSRSLYYFPLFEKALDKYNLPLELKYLPVIESALNPNAKSGVGAAGLWQFMYATGKMQGLTVSSYVDDRMDPVKSTEAAAQYLSELYKIFGKWDLVLAAYNGGLGRVTKAIRRSGGETDFWKLKSYLPRETQNYVPAFMAVLYIFNYAQDYGFEPYMPPKVYYDTDTIHVRQTIKFDQIAEVTGVDEDLISFLNPAYKLHIVPYIEGKDYYIRLPKEAAGIFAANEDLIYNYNVEKLADVDLPKYYLTRSKIHYRVRSGDYLGKIAKRYGVSVSRIKRWNRMRGNTIRVGQSLLIYPGQPVASGKYKDIKPKAAQKKSTTKQVAQAPKKTLHKTYTVQKGDTLWSISKKFSDISIAEIKKWNDISGNKLKPGMTLKISES